VVVTSNVGLAIESSTKLGVPACLFPEPDSDTKEEGFEILARVIIDAVSGYHRDPWINEFIKQWINGYRSLHVEGQEKAEKFCEHEHIEGETKRYSCLLGTMCGLKEPLLEDATNGLKALLQLRKKPDSFVTPEEWFESWDVNQPVTDRKPIGSESLKRLFEVVCGVDTVEIDIRDEKATSIDEVRLPVQPALSFIIGLRILVQALRNHPGGSIFGESMCLIGRGGMHQLSIALTISPDKMFGVAKRWIGKCEGGGAPIMTNGVCARLWNLSQAKVIEISKTVARNDVEKALLGVFQGPGRPIAAVGFAPHFIQLYWRTSK
jgi:hypothetical protein